MDLKAINSAKIANRASDSEEVQAQKSQKLKLNSAQKEAVEYLSGPLLVLAGPGTGKTQLLSEKVIYILEHTDTNPENILCLTFTDSGASNMRERLRSLIKSDALKVNIYTYHAFGAEILAQYKNYAESYERRLDNAIDEVTRYTIIKMLQEQLPARDILRGDSVKDITGIISDAKSARLTAADLATIAEQNMADAKILSEAISPLLKNHIPRKYQESLEGAYLPINQILSKYQNIEPILGNIERSIAGLARDLSTAIDEAAEDKKLGILSAWKDKYFELDGKGNYRLKDRVANLKLASIAKIMDKYEKYLLKNGLYDFDDMIEEAVKVLRTDKGFKLSLEERYQYIMLDEFQDTNPSQFAIVKELTDYEKPNIMAVGDDNQAIYEFQGALSSNLTDFEKHYSAKVIALTENYRSTQEILDFSREIINQATDRFADKKLTAHRPNPIKSQIQRYEFLSADAEYAYIANQIADLIRQGVKQDQIAIISYKTKYFEPLLPYLKSHPEIKIAYEKRDNLLEDQKIHEILTILRFVNDLANEKKPSVQLMEILTFPFFNLPTIEVLRLADQARAEHIALFEALAKATPEKYQVADKFHAIAEFLADLVAKSYCEPLDNVISQIVKYIEDNSSYESTFDQFTFYENLASLEGKLKQHVGDKSLHVADLLKMIDDYEIAEMQLTATSPYRDTDEAVQVLTAHKAKGLEFEYVFIISADHSAWGKGKGNNTFLSIPKNLTQIHHTGMTDSERLRVLYVALTRAKKALVITNSLHDFNNKNSERLEYFNEYVTNEDGEEAVISPYLPDKKVHLEYTPASTEELNNNLKNWLVNFRPKSPEMRTIYQERIQNWRMSASALTSFIDVVYAGPEEFFKNYILRAPREPISEALAFGDLIHKTFEAVTNQGLSQKQALDFYQSAIDDQNLSKELAEILVERGTHDLQISLEAFSDVLREGQAEVDLGPERLVVAGIPITGKIDHISINENDQTIEIYDFKTGGYHKQKWQSHPTLYKYMLQLGFYKLLLNNSPRYSKYKVEKAHILFVTPDKDNEVYDKVYEFSKEEENDLLNLMKAVYHQVSTLNFIDDADLMIPPQNTRSLKDIKKFIELLHEKYPGE